MWNMDDVFAARMRQARERLSKSQEQVAVAMQLVGYDFQQVTVSRIENGRRKASVGEAFALADALGVDVATLVGRGEQEPQHPAMKLLHEANEALQRAMREIGGRDA